MRTRFWISIGIFVFLLIGGATSAWWIAKHQSPPPYDFRTLTSSTFVTAGLRPIQNPTWESSSETTWDDTTPIIGLAAPGTAQAFPVAMMRRHGIVEEDFAGAPIVLTYSELCDTAVAIDRRTEKRTLRFSISPIAYESCLVLEDVETKTLWSQPVATAIQGTLAGTHLKTLPIVRTTLGAWVKEYPNTVILAASENPHPDYTTSAFPKYIEDPSLFLPADHQGLVLHHPKDAETFCYQPTSGNFSGWFSGRAQHEAVRASGTVVISTGSIALSVGWDERLETVEIFAYTDLLCVQAYGFVYPAFFGK